MTDGRDNPGPALLLEIPLSELPAGTRVRIDAGDLIRLLSSRQSSMDLILSDGSACPPGDAPSFDRFLEADELVRSGYGELSVSEAAKQLGISRQAVLTAVKRGAIAARRVGGVFLVDARSVRSYRPRRRSGRGGGET
jgi:excisionase family DNA binding protein